MNTFNNDFWYSIDKLLDNCSIIIDRPKVTSHPKYPDFIYHLDYGYLENTSSQDGYGIDVWLGSKERQML